MAIAESPKVASTVGLKSVVYAILNSDTEAGTTYGEIKAFAGAIDINIAPENADADVQYFDDAEGHALYPDPDVRMTMEMADVPLAVQQEILGDRIDDNGVLIRTAGTQRPYFALGFKSLKSDNTYRHVWLYKGRANPLTETYHTKEGTTITRQTGKLECAFIKRISDNHFQALADDGENGFKGDKTFFETVYSPVFSGT